MRDVRRGAPRRVPTAEREAKEKDGVFTGRHVDEPGNGEPIPIWVADYVLMEYGTGAIMGVPAHDERDHAFAERYGLPIVRSGRAGATARPSRSGAFVAHTENEVLVNSGEFDGLPAPEGKQAIVEWLAERGLGAARRSATGCATGCSRASATGAAPIPVVYCDACGIVPVPDERAAGAAARGRGVPAEGPLAARRGRGLGATRRARAAAAPARRETDTMDTFVDSSWYFLRYCDPHNDEAPFDREIVDYWLPVDQYIGGVEHAILHLLYARFFVKVLNDLGLVGFRRAVRAALHQGMLDHRRARRCPSPRGTSISPDEYVERHGADAVRLYLLFIGPVDQDAEWQDAGFEGIVRFLHRLWRAVLEQAERRRGEPPSTDTRCCARRTRRSRR